MQKFNFVHLLLGLVFLLPLVATAQMKKVNVGVCFSNVHSNQGMIIQQNGNEKRFPGGTSIADAKPVPVGTNFYIYSLQMQPLLTFVAAKKHWLQFGSG